MSYIGTEPKDIRSFGRTKFDYTATQGQTAFTGADDDGKVLAFTVGQIEVYVNGILMDDSDFTTTGTGTVTLASAANLNDVINIVSFESNIPDNDYVPASGGTFTGNVTNSGTVTNSGNVTVGGTLGVTGATTAAGLTASGTVQSTELVANNAGNNTNIRVQNTASGSGSSDGFLIQNATNSKVYLWNYENADVLFGTNGTERLKIDSSGRVTTANQPCFIAYTNSNFATTANSNSIARNINGTYANVGNHYSTSGGTASRFTAPVAGKYLFGFQILLQNVATSDDSIHISFHKNGSLNQYANARYEGEAANGNLGFGGYLPIIGTTLQDLAANDYIEINLYSSGSIWLYNDSTWTRYYGYLLG